MKYSPPRGWHFHKGGDYFTMEYSPPGEYLIWNSHPGVTISWGEYLILHRSGDKPLSEPMMVSLMTHICVARPQWVNWLTPGRCGSNSICGFFKLRYLEYLLWNGLKWVAQNPINCKSTLVQVIAWYRQATSHYLSQCWPRSVSSKYAVIMS